MRFLVLAISLYPLTCPAAPPTAFRDDAPIIVQRIVEATEHCFGRDSEVARAVVDEVMHRERPFRERGEVLALYHSVLKRAGGVTAKGFIENTRDTYRRLEPTFADLREGVVTAGGGGKLAATLSPNQSLFFMTHYEQLATPAVRDILELFKKFPASIPDQLKSKIWNETLPRLIDPPPRQTERDAFLAIYNGILGSWSEQEPALREYLQATGPQYRALKPTIAEMVESSRMIRISPLADRGSLYDGGRYIGGKRNLPESLLHTPDPQVRFLLEHLEASRSLTEAGEIMREIRRRRADLDRWKNVVVNSGEHVVDSSLEQLADTQYLKHLAGYVFTPNEPDFAARAIAQEAVMRGHEVHANTRAWFIFQALGKSQNLGDYLKLLEAAERAFGAKAKEFPDQRFEDILAWNPSLEQLRALYGGRTMTVENLKKLRTPEAFLAFFKDALAGRLWTNTKALGDFLDATLPNFYAANPTPGERHAMVELLRNRPFPRAQLRAMAEAHADDPTALKKELARLAVGQLAVPGEDLAKTTEEDRAQRRRDALEVIAHHREKLFPGISDERLVAEIARDGLAGRAAAPAERLRVLARLGDDLRHAEADHVVNEAIGHLPHEHPEYTFADALALVARAPKGDADAEARRLAGLGALIARDARKAFPEAAALAPARRRWAPEATDEAFSLSLVRDLHAKKLVDGATATRVVVQTALSMADPSPALGPLRVLLAEKPTVPPAVRLSAALLLPRVEAQRVLADFTEWDHPLLPKVLEKMYPEGETEAVRMAMLVRDIAEAKGTPPPALLARLGDGPQDLDAAVILRDAPRLRGVGDLVKKLGGRDLAPPAKCGPSLWQRLFGRS